MSQKITITITIEESEQPQTIKGSIMEQVAIADANKAISDKLIVSLKEKILEARRSVITQLNKTIGEDLWSERNMGGEAYNTYSSDNSGTDTYMIRTDIQLQYGCHKYFDFRLFVTLNKHEYGQRYWYSLKDGNVQMQLQKSCVNHTPKLPIKDLARVHELAEKDYINYFTSKSK